jgi:hypothetical protein
MSDELNLVLRSFSDPDVRKGVKTLIGTEPVREALAMLADRVRGHRAKVQIKVLKNTISTLNEAGLSINVVPAKTLVPLLEFSSLEDPDDEKMVHRWANLLANAAAGEQGSAVPPSFPDVLRQLEPLEAQFLEEMLRARDTRPKRMNWVDLDLDQIDGHQSIEWRHLENLERLGLIQFEVDLPVNVTPPPQPSGVARVSETSFCISFIQACRPLIKAETT